MGIKGLFGIDIISGVMQFFERAMIPYFTLFYAEVPIYFDRDCLWKKKLDFSRNWQVKIEVCLYFHREKSIFEEFGQKTQIKWHQRTLKRLFVLSKIGYLRKLDFWKKNIISSWFLAVKWWKIIFSCQNRPNTATWTPQFPGNRHFMLSQTISDIIFGTFPVFMQ